MFEQKDFLAPDVKVDVFSFCMRSAEGSRDWHTAFVSVCSFCDLVKPPSHPYPSISTCNVSVKVYVVAPCYCMTYLLVIITLIYVVWVQILFYSQLLFSTSLRVESSKQCYCQSGQRMWLGCYCAFLVKFGKGVVQIHLSPVTLLQGLRPQWV